MTDDDLTAMEALAAKATAGPWFAHNPDDAVFMNVFCVTASEHEPLTDEGDFTEVIAATLSQNGDKIGAPDGRWEANAAFIAESRQFVPDAITEIRRLRAELSYLRSTGATNVE